MAYNSRRKSGREEVHCDSGGCTAFFKECDPTSMQLVAFGAARGDFLALNDDGPPCWSGLPDPLDNKLRGRQAELSSPKLVALGPEDIYGAGRFFLEFEDGERLWHGPESLSALLEPDREADVKRVVFGPNDGWLVLWDDDTTSWEHIPLGLANLLRGRERRSLSPLVDASIALDTGAWIAVFEDGLVRSANAPKDLLAELEGSQSETPPFKHIECVELGPGGSYWCRYRLEHPAPRTWRVNPTTIRFTQDTIASSFQCGTRLKDAIHELRRARLGGDTKRLRKLKARYLPVEVYLYRKKWWSLDNRRLHVFQKAGIRDIEVVQVQRSAAAKRKQTPRTDGRSVVVRGSSLSQLE